MNRLIGTSERAGGRRVLAALALCVLVGIGLRAVEAGRKSLWIDELHTIHHASGAGLGDVVDNLRPDFHAPLYYFAVHPFREASGHALRWLSILPGLLALLPLLALARESGVGVPGRITLAGTFAALPYQILFGTELRPYPWLQLAAASAAWCVFSERGPRRLRFGLLVLATAFGLHVHYLMPVALLGLAVARLLVRSPGMLSFRASAVAVLLGGLLFLPWLIEVESWIFTDVGVLVRDEKVAAAPPPETAPSPPAGSLRDRFVVAARELPRTLVPMGSSLGGTAATLIRPLTVALVGIVLLLGLGWVATAPVRRPHGRPVVGALLGGLLTLGLLFVASAPSGYGMRIQYFVLSAWVWPLALGVGVDALPFRRARTAVAAGVLLLTLAAGTTHVLGASREDLRTAVARARELGGPDAIYTAILRQPDYFSSVSLYREYAPDLDFREPGDVPPAAEESRPVIVVDRKRPWTAALHPAIGDGRRAGPHLTIDDAVGLQAFSPRSGR